MGEEIKPKIIINDLLSFLTCKAKVTPKEKLLKCMSDYYSDNTVAEAQKTLLASLPIKKSTRHGRRVKNPDLLVAIYDCIQLIPEEDLPIFVCKDLNNVPQLNIIKKEIEKYEDQEDEYEEEDECNEGDESSQEQEEYEESENDNDSQEENEPNYDDDDEELLEDDKEFYRKEQKQMRSQISEMISIIKDLKDGLQKLTQQTEASSEHNSHPISSKKPKRENLLNLPESETKRRKSVSTDDEKMEEGSSSDDDSQLNGLAYLQKLIDEDDENNKLLLAGKDESLSDEEDLDDPDDIDDFEDYDFAERKQLQLEQSDTKTITITNKSEAFGCKKPAVVVSPDKSGKKIICIKSEEDNSIIDDIDINPIEHSIEISSSSDYIGRVEEIDAPSAGPTSRMSTTLVKREGIYGKEMDVHKFITEGLNSDTPCATNQCPICEITFSSKLDYDMHAKIHISKGTYDCTLCNLSFGKRDELFQHFFLCLEEMKKTYGLDNHMCPLCSSFFAERSSLEKHMSLHSECKPYLCPHCTYRFLTKMSLENHIKNQHSSLNKFPCPLCKHTYICNKLLMSHISIHVGEKPFSCNICQYRAATKTAMKKHLHTHGKPKEFKCKQCDFTSLGCNKLIKHRQKVHKEPVFCSICGKLFKNPYLYKRHYEAHMGQENFKCSLCLYTTALKRPFNKHMKTHTSSRPFACPECSVPLASKHNIARHLKSYCSKKPPVKFEKSSL